MTVSLLITLLSITAASSEVIAASETAPDISANIISDAEDILTRSRRPAEPDTVCRYKKEEWGTCDDKVMVREALKKMIIFMEF